MDIARLIQSSIAPVFLFSGVAATLSVLTHRLSRIVDRARAERDAELESWRNAATRASAVGNLASHWQAEERLAADRIEQKETDEHSQQLWSRRTIARGS